MIYRSQLYSNGFPHPDGHNRWKLRTWRPDPITDQVMEDGRRPLPPDADCVITIVGSTPEACYEATEAALAIIQGVQPYSLVRSLKCM